MNVLREMYDLDTSLLEGMGAPAENGQIDAPAEVRT